MVVDQQCPGAVWLNELHRKRQRLAETEFELDASFFVRLGVGSSEEGLQRTCSWKDPAIEKSLGKLVEQLAAAWAL